MEGLFDLDMAVAKAASSTKCEEVTSVASETTTPKAKRFRSLMHMARAASSHASASELGDPENLDSALVLAGGDEGVSPEGSADGVQKCSGCNRDRDNGASYLNPDEKVPWANKDGRGHWCGNCHTVWRTCYQPTYSLMGFGTWLRASPENMKDFQINLVSFLSISFEGSAKLTQGMIFDRRRLLLWLSSLLCVPLVPSMLCRLSELTGPKPDASMLCNIQEGDQIRIGVWVASGPELPDAAVARPAVPFTGAPLGVRVALRPGSADDNAKLRELFGESSPLDLVAPVVPTSQLALPRPAPSPANKLQGKLAQAIAGASEILRLVSGSSWEGLKESSFSSSLTKLLNLRAQAGAIGAGETGEECQIWVDGLSAGKAFFRGYREWVRTKYNQKRLVEVQGPANTFVAFVRAHAPEPMHASFELVWHRVNLAAETTEELKPPAAALEQRFKLGLDSCLRRFASSPRENAGGVTADTWLRAVLLPSLSSRLSREFPADDVTAAAKVLHEEIVALGVVLQGSSAVQEFCEETVADITDYGVLLRASADPENCAAIQLTQAMKNLQSPRNQELHAALAANGDGALLSAGALLLQHTAKDIAGDDKLKLAMQAARDPKWPSLADAAGDVAEREVLNFEVLQDMSVVHAMDESMGYIAEALSLWGRARREQQAGEVRVWFNTLLGKLCFQDQCLSNYLRGLVDGAGFDALPQGKVEQKPENIETLTGNFASVAEAVRESAIDEDAFKAFLGRLLSFAERSASAESEVSKTVEQLISNVDVRAHVSEALQFCETIGDPPATAAAAIEEWQAKKAVGGEKRSFLAKALELTGGLSMLRQSALACPQHVKGVSFLFRFGPCGAGSAEKRMVVAQEVAPRLPADVCELSFPLYVTHIVSQVMPTSAESFLNVLHMSALKTPPASHMRVSTVGLSEVPQYMTMLVDAQKLDGTGDMTSKVFANGRCDETAWPCKNFFTLLVDVGEVTPEDSWKVDFSPMLPPGQKFMSEDKTQSLEWLGLFLRVSMIAQAFAWLASQCEPSSDLRNLLAKTSLLREDIQACVEFLRVRVATALDVLEKTRLKSTAEFLGLPWLYPLDDLKVWLSGVQLQMTSTCRFLLSECLGGASKLAASVQGYTPRYEHVVNDQPRRYNSALARKLLLGWPSRQQLNESTCALFTAIASISQLHAQWQLEPGLSDDPLFAESVDMCNALFEEAKKAITVIAAVNVLLELQGAPKVDQARVLIEKKSDLLPEVLLSELRKIKGAGPVSSNALAAASGKAAGGAGQGCDRTT